MPSYQERVELNAKVTEKQLEEGEHIEAKKAKCFRELCAKVDKIPIISSALDFQGLISNCSKVILRSESEHTEMEGNCRLVQESCRFIAVSSEHLVYFIKQGLSLPFGPKVSEKVCMDTMEAILELEEIYPPPQPKKDMRHRRMDFLKAKHKTLGVYHFAYWMQQGHPHTPPTLSQNCFARGYKLEAVAKFLRRIATLVQILCLLFLIIDPAMYESYWKKFQKDCGKSSSVLFKVSLP